jgi:hypothetical protein
VDTYRWAVDRRKLTPLVVALAVVVVGAGYWAVKVRERAGASAVAAHVAQSHPGSQVRCVEMQSNGAAWVCGAVYKAESVCVRANVSFMGSITEADGKHRCAQEPALRAIAPHAPTAAAVAADVTRTEGGQGQFVCIQPGKGTSRWLCGRRSGSAVACLKVGLVIWQTLKVKPGGDTCHSKPALRQAGI